MRAKERGEGRLQQKRMKERIKMCSFMMAVIIVLASLSSLNAEEEDEPLRSDLPRRKSNITVSQLLATYKDS